MGRDVQSSLARSTQQAIDPKADHAPSLAKSSVIQDIEEFFKYRPPTLVKAQGHTPSESTRTPSIFDRHFDQSLRLRHVRYLPSIARDLERIAEEALEAACLAGTLPVDSAGFPNPKVRDEHLNLTPKKITAESQVQETYAGTTAKYCACVASTLEFQLPEWRADGFSYELIDPDKKEGIADGFLRIDGSAHTDPGTAKDFPVVAIWEFKNLNFCTKLKMEAFRQLANNAGFFWKGCEHGKLCGVHHKALPGETMTTGYKMGLDAQIDPCGCSGAVLGPPPCEIRKVDQDTAYHVTQQVWAEAVHDDATFVVISTGNLEMIGIRDRQSQTLYLSDIIEADNCDYGKLHTGLFIAAYRDAKDRSSRLRLAKTTPDSWLKVYNRSFADQIKTKGIDKADDQEIMQRAQKRDWLIIHTRKSSSNDSFRPETYYIRIPPSKPLIDQCLLDAHASHFRVHIKGLIKPNINSGFIESDGTRQRRHKAAYSGGVVLKHGNTPALINQLFHEYEVYYDLHKADVIEIPKLIGIFRYANVEENDEFVWPYVTLVMENAGTPVAHLGEQFSRDHLIEFTKVLGCIHDKDYVHGNLSKNNLLMRSRAGGVAIVGFGYARKTSEPREKEEELEHLLKIWANPLKRREDGSHTVDFDERFSTGRFAPQAAVEGVDSGPPRKKKPRLSKDGR